MHGQKFVKRKRVLKKSLQDVWETIQPEAPRHGREEHAQFVPQKHGRSHRGSQEPIALP